MMLLVGRVHKRAMPQETAQLAQAPSPRNHTLPFHLQGLELAVPGTYIAGEPVVTIAAFAPQLHVITSKQRPRKLTIHGSDGAEYMFLLKVGPPRQSLPRHAGARLALSSCTDLVQTKTT